MADAQDCRLLVVNANRTVAHQIGTDGFDLLPNGSTPTHPVTGLML